MITSLVAAAAQAQILNPGFESAGANDSAAANWTVTQAAGGPVYGVRTNSSPRSGSYHFETRLASTGAGPVVEVTQGAIPVTGGTTYPFTFFSKAVTGSSGYNAQWRIVWNAGGETGFCSFTPGNNIYALISNSITAPSAATSASLFFYFAGAASPSQSATIHLDDVSLGGTIVDPGTTNRIAASISKATAIRWYGSNNVTYQVQWAAELAGNATIWSNLGPAVVGSGLMHTVFDPAEPPHNHHRVVSIEPASSSN